MKEDNWKLNMRSKVFWVSSLIGGSILLMVSIYLQLSLPTLTGPYAVGETVLKWVDTSRPEVLTADSNDFREVPAVIWYPAESGTGTKSLYIPGISTISKALVESGEVQAWQVLGLPFVRSKNLLNAKLAKSHLPYPVVILSPGNGTNVEFYTGLVSEIASHGYVVVGINHPYDVAAVELSNHSVASFYKEEDSLELSAHQAFIAERIKVRTADVLFALKQLEVLNSSRGNIFAEKLDLDSVAVIGHSLGGITASEACKADVYIRACLNFDGLQKGGPFSAEETAIPPKQPFMFMTKESQLHPKLIAQFESTSQSYWVILRGASHDSFTDGPLLQPHLLPISNQADKIMSLMQKYTLAFLDQSLKGQQSNLLSKSADLQEMSIKVYPS